MSNLTPYACLECHKVFKRPVDKTIPKRSCPECGSVSYLMDVRFRAPKKSDKKQWEKVAFLVKHGFFFQKVYHKYGDMWRRARYPGTLKEAEKFVVKFRDQAKSYNV